MSFAACFRIDFHPALTMKCHCIEGTAFKLNFGVFFTRIHSVEAKRYYFQRFNSILIGWQLICSLIHVPFLGYVFTMFSSHPHAAAVPCRSPRSGNVYNIRIYQTVSQLSSSTQHMHNTYKMHTDVHAAHIFISIQISFTICCMSSVDKDIKIKWTH